MDSAKAYAYCRALAAASPRVRVFTIGRSEEGRDILMVAVADEAGIRELDRLKAATAALADPRRTDPAAADRLIQNARPIYYFNAALHSDETGSTEAMLEMAYRLAVSEQPMIRRIREQLVVLINPVSNPDGRDKMVEWFYRYLKGKTDRATLPRQSPPYWSKYAFVDINRDTHQQTHETTKAVHRMFHEWHPTVVHDLHEGQPMLMTWNGTGPYNPNIDPITYTEFLELSFHEVQTLTAMGMPGVSTWNFGEAFAHLYLDSVAMNHNSIGRGYETWGNGTAETLRRVVPPSRGQHGVVSAAASARRRRHLVGPRQPQLSGDSSAGGARLQRGQCEGDAPQFLQEGLGLLAEGFERAAIRVPDSRRTRRSARESRRWLAGCLVSTSRWAARKQTLKLKDGEYPAGTYVVRLDQPYRNYAVDLLTPQHYPKDGSEPYDDVSWELPAHYQLQAIPTADASVRSAALTPLTEAAASGGQRRGRWPGLLAERHRAGGTARSPLPTGRLSTSKLPNTHLPPAESTSPPDRGSCLRKMDWPMRFEATANELGSRFRQRGCRPRRARGTEAKAARIGVWVPWADTDSIGWVRYSLDQRKIPYTYLRDEDIRAGCLRDHVDVLLYGHVDLELAEQIQGLPKAWGPMPFKNDSADAELRHARGVGRHHRRHRMGGSGSASTLCRRWRTARDPGQRLDASARRRHRARRSAFLRRRAAQHAGRWSGFCRGGAAGRHPHSGRARARNFRPARFSAGLRLSRRTLTSSAKTFRSTILPRRWLRMAYCTTCLDGPEDRSHIVMEWGDRDGAPFVVSGQAWGESRLIGRPAILDMPVGRGHVVAFNFNPLHRDLNRGDHRLVWNAIINWQAILAGRH